jgi:leucyl-tRNA synthetase
LIHCAKCGIVPVPEKDLPVELPKEVKFGSGNPLLTNKEWLNVKCPKCKGNARREANTMDTFVNSSWYFIRYCDNKNDKKIFDKKKANYWCPVDQYIGGAEHACMHLIYFRFYTKFLRDIGLLNFDEPAKRLFHQGMLHGEDGEKMSKSRGNTIDPIDTIKKYGADSLRLALMSFASPDSDTNWDEKVLVGSYKFLKKIYDKFCEIKISKKSNPKIESKLNKSIKEISNQIENFKYNLAIIKLRDLFNLIISEDEVQKEILEKSLKLLSPFCPHISEELFEKIGGRNFICLDGWPKVEEKKIDDKFDKQEESVEKLVGDILNISRIIESRGETKTKVFVYVLPNEKEFYSAEEVSKRVGKQVQIYAVNDSKKYDPNRVSKKAKPGKPGIYFE